MMPRFILDTLSCGDWVGVFPAPMLQKSPRPELVGIPLEPQMPWQIAMITKKGRYVSSAANSFLNFSREFLSQLA